MSYPTVSIIMALTDRIPQLERCLCSWWDLDYINEYEFIIIDNNSIQKDRVKQIVDEFATHGAKVKLLQFHQSTHPTEFEWIGNPQQLVINTNVLWNIGYKESKNEFVIFTMPDLIISNKQVLQHMVNSYKSHRVSVITYQLSEAMTNMVDSIDWKTNPELIETLSGFWVDPSVVNKTRTSAGLLSYLTGQYRKDWEYFGLFRNNPKGYLWIDQDVHCREMALGFPCETVSGVVCYHQHHPATLLTSSPGYRYHNGNQARLLEPAEQV